MGIKRSNAQRHKDRLVISDLYLKGNGQYQIAEKLGISQATVSRDIKVLIRYWKIMQQKNVDSLKEQELAKINKLEVEAWEAWEKSKTQFRSTTIKRQGLTKENIETLPAETTVRTEDQCGDPRFLQSVQWCIQRRIEIFGLNSPLEVNVATHPRITEIEVSTDEEKE